MLTNGIWQQIVPLRMDFCCYRVIMLLLLLKFLHSLAFRTFYFECFFFSLSHQSICLSFWVFGHHSWSIYFVFAIHLSLISWWCVRWICVGWKMVLCTTGNALLTHTAIEIYQTPLAVTWKWCKTQKSIWYAFTSATVRPPHSLNVLKYQCYGQTQFAHHSFDRWYCTDKCVLQFAIEFIKKTVPAQMKQNRKRSKLQAAIEIVANDVNCFYYVSQLHTHIEHTIRTHQSPYSYKQILCGFCANFRLFSFLSIIILISLFRLFHFRIFLLCTFFYYFVNSFRLVAASRCHMIDLFSDIVSLAH